MRPFFIPVFAVLFYLVLMILPLSASAQSHALSVGYGFGLLSNDRTIGHIEEGGYDFVNLTFQYERSLSPLLGLIVEPFASYTINPEDGIDVGATLLLKYRFQRKQNNAFFVTIGGGTSYTSINFKEQGTHFFFIIQGGIGYRWKNFFVENRFKHYSNGGTETPNKSINSNIVMVGMYF